MANKFDLLVIGGGSGGVAAAKKAASYGANVALFESNQIGGTCVNVGCVPKKIMWYAGEIAETNNYCFDYGFEFQQWSFDFKKLVSHRQQFISKLHHIYEQQLQDQHVTYIKGRASFLDTHTVQVNNECYSGDNIIIATGCDPDRPAIKGAELGIDSDGFFKLTAQPKKVAIIGAGYIAVELASLLNQLGAEVKLFIRQDKLLRHFDSMLSDTLMENMLANGVQILPNHEINEVVKTNNGQLKIFFKNEKDDEVDCLIFAIGRTPRTKKIQLNKINVYTNRSGYIVTDKWEATNIPHIYAIGDVTGKRLLTPVAIAAGTRLASRVFGKQKDAYLDYDNIPTVLFSHPPVGSVGLSEQDAVSKYGRDNLTIYQTQFYSLIFALSKHKVLSRMKLVTLKETGKVIGCHLIGPGADEILQGFAVAIKMGATKKDFENTVAIHPTNAEELVIMK